MTRLSAQESPPKDFPPENQSNPNQSQLVRILNKITHIAHVQLGVCAAHIHLFETGITVFSGKNLGDSTQENPWFAWVAPKPLVIPDVLKEDASPQAQMFRFYACFPLINSKGDVLGSLCLTDTSPRNPSPSLLDSAETLASLAGHLVEEGLALEQARKELRQSQRAMAAKRDFVGNLSHEVRNDLNGILGAIELLKELELPPEIQKVIPILNTCTHSAISMLNDTLDLNKIDTDNIEISARAFSVQDHLRIIFDSFEHRAKSHNIKIHLNVDPNLQSQRWGDDAKLRQVLNNLIQNSIKYSHGTEISLSATLVEGNQVRFSVVDNGLGIPSEKIGQLFQPYVQVHRETHEGGSGLGLAICKHLIKHLGGDIGCSSQAHQKTEFWFTVPLPLAKSEQLDMASSDSPERRLPEGFSLLLVDDDTINLTIIRHILESGGAKIAVAASGTEALKALENQNFDAVLADLRMPHMDGVELAHHIRQQLDIPIMTMTASIFPEDLTRCEQAGLPILKKPIPRNKLIASLLELVNDQNGP